MAKSAKPLDPSPQAIRRLGASIAGEKVLSQARKYTPKANIIKQINGKASYVRFLLKVNAYCVVRRAFRATQAGTPSSGGTTAGSALHGEHITVQARVHKFLRLVRGSSKHRIQRCDFEGDCYCVINLPLRGLHISP